MKKDIGLVLSSGGARGATQIGVIKTLEKQGYNIKSVSGASIGSMIAGMYARGDLYEFEQWITSLSEEEILNLLGFTLKKNGILKVDGFFEILNQKFPDKNIEDLNIPCAIAATDLIKNKPLYFTKGSLYKAMRASIAIPSLIVPVQYDNTILVDGGLLDPVPIEPLPNKDKLKIFVINLYANEEGKKLVIKKENDQIVSMSKRNRRYNAFINRIENFISRANVKNILDYITSPATSPYNIGYIQLLNASAIAMIERLVDLSLQTYKPDVVIDIPKDICKALDFGNIKELIAYGEVKAEETLNNLDK